MRSITLLVALAAAIAAHAQGTLVGYTVVVRADSTGHSAEVLERTVTEPLERGLGKLSQVAQIRSQTSHDQSIVTITLKSAGAPSCDTFRRITEAALEAHRVFPIGVSVPVISFGGGRCEQEQSGR